VRAHELNDFRRYLLRRSGGERWLRVVLDAQLDRLRDLALVADTSLPELPEPDIVLVPGGPGHDALMADGPEHEWLRGAHDTSTWTTSVCTGSLILAAAGLLEGKRATSHWLSLEGLGRLGAQPVSERVVSDGKLVTAAGVSAGIDMALTLAAKIAGDQVGRCPCAWAAAPARRTLRSRPVGG
jgi:transcriptional regulator GlxA family with amidase domain